jgi:hypothetical protein
MRSRATFACLAVAVTALVGCGSTTNKAATTAPTSTEATQPLTTVSYNVKLVPADGTTRGSGHASITIDASSHELCWKFSQLKNVTITISQQRGSVAVIQPTPAGTPATPGTLLGIGYKSSGCLLEHLASLDGLESHPQQYYLSLYNTKTGQVVRGPL